MPVYGDSLEAWAVRMKEFLPSGQRDWSMDVAVHLGLALAALDQLRAQGVRHEVQITQAGGGCP